MLKRVIIYGIFSMIMMGINAQDILLTLSGREVPCLLHKVDTFFVFYTPLSEVKTVEKSNVKKITPHQLLMNDGTKMDVVFDLQSNDVNGPYIYYREKSKTERKKDRYNFFSVTTFRFDTLLPYQDSIAITKVEKVLYAQDSLHKKFELNPHEMRAYVFGRRSARKNFISPWSTMGGIAVGIPSGIALNFFYAAVPSLVYCAVNGSIRPKVGLTSPEDKEYLTDEFFIDGYRNQARLLKVKNSVIASLPSLGVGMAIRAIATVY